MPGSPESRPLLTPCLIAAAPVVAAVERILSESARHIAERMDDDRLGDVRRLHFTRGQPDPSSFPLSVPCLNPWYFGAILGSPSR